MTCIQVFDLHLGVQVNIRDIKQILCEQQQDVLMDDFYSTKADFEYEAHLVMLGVDGALEPELTRDEQLSFQINDLIYKED